MLIYNVTTSVTWEIQEAWLSWMQQVHIPAVMATGCFQDVRFARILDLEDAEGPTYTTQYTIKDRSDYDRFLNKFDNPLRAEVFGKWGNQQFGFRSLMQLVN